ncbi:hypothetical protein GC194_05980, partial [bacterium]|nr:hypothetical protein [bacterium]
MREELKHIERIDRYLENAMDEAEKAAFEQEMANNTDLQKETEFYKVLKEGISRQAIKLDIKKAQYRYIKKSRKWTRLRRLLFGSGGFLVLVVAVFLVTLPDEERETGFIYNLLHHRDIALVKNYESDPYNEYLPESEFYTINPDEDTVISTGSGLKVYVPKGALRTKNGKIPDEAIVVEIAEAKGNDEAVLGNLMTENDGVEPEKVFFINAKAGDEQLVADAETPPYVEVPTEAKKPEMKVFNGVRSKEGNMQWSSPRLPDNFLTPIAFKYLDYYPAGFEKAVTENLPYKGHKVADRKLLDSLYFSTLKHVVMTIGDPNDYATWTNEVSYSDCVAEDHCGICPVQIQTITQAKFERSLLATREFMARLQVIYKTCDQQLLDIYINNTSKQLWEIDEM